MHGYNPPFQQRDGSYIQNICILTRLWFESLVIHLFLGLPFDTNKSIAQV